MKGRRSLAASALVLLVSAVLTGAGVSQLSDTFTNWLDHPAIDYKSRPARDLVAQLNSSIQEGRVKLKYEGPSGYLRSVLEALAVPIDSQMAVFAQDSVQATRISRGNPRTIFFNDSVAVGWVRGGFIELAAQDPQQGVIFYSLNQSWVGNPQFARRNDCLTCHYSYATTGIPGMLVRSVGQFEVDHRIPFEKRWGGWYVTGKHGSIRHMGNADLDKLFESPPPANTFNWPSLEGKFDTAGYLSAHSDIVALMVFEHQMHMMNLLSRIGWEARVADYQRRIGRMTPNGAPDSQSDTPVQIGDAARELVDYLLFIDEAPLAGEIQGSTDFTKRFSAQGPRDRNGRSLRELDLTRRLMRYRCSYMIYGQAFDSLPAEAKDAIYRRTWQILSGREKSTRYARLGLKDRQAVVEILRDTKKDLPDYFDFNK